MEYELGDRVKAKSYMGRNLIGTIDVITSDNVDVYSSPLYAILLDENSIYEIADGTKIERIYRVAGELKKI